MEPRSRVIPIASRTSHLPYIWGFWRPYRRVLVAIVSLTIVNTAIVMSAPLVTQRLIDRLGAGIAGGELAVLAGLLVGIAVAQFATYVVLQGLRARMNLTLEWRFRQRAFENLVRLSPRFFGRYRTGDLVTRLTDDVAEKLSWFSCSGIFRAFEATSRVAIGLVAMLFLSPLLTAVSVLPLPLVVLVFIRTRRALQSRFDRRQKAISAGSDLVESAFAGIRVVKAYRHEPPLAARYAERVAERKSAEIAAVRAEVLMGTVYAQTWQTAVVLCLTAGGWLVIDGRITLGTLIAMTSYVQMLVFPMFDIGQFFVASMRAAVSIGRLRELEEAPPEVVDPARPAEVAAPAGALAFEDVSLRLGADHPVLAGVSFTVRPGTRVAVVGPIGSGKSVLVRLVPRLLDPDLGRILLDGVPLPDLRLDELRRRVAYVPQDPILFSGTIEENLRAGRDEVSREEIGWACRIARLEADLAALPDGLATVVGARGVKLSGGQKQRVSLARALIGKPRVLVLDDCTASLDASTEAALWDELDRALPGGTCLFITHRTATLERADAIVVLEKGRVVETGTHRDLIVAGGTYEGLYRRRRLEEAVLHERDL